MKNLNAVIDAYAVEVYEKLNCRIDRAAEVLGRNEKTVRFILVRAGRLKTTDKRFKDRIERKVRDKYE